MVFYIAPEKLVDFRWYFEFAWDNTILHVSPWDHALPFGAVALYIFTCWAIPKILIKPLGFVDKIIPAWNFFLWVFSVAMFVGSAHGVWGYVSQLGFFGFICNPVVTETPSPLVFWTYVFGLSKFIELFDTVWILLKYPQKPVELLHWWHHITVLLFTWYSLKWQFGIGLVFSTMNALVHSFMYYYYFAMSIGIKPSWAKALTLGQISQMVIGTALNLYFVYLYIIGVPCTCKRPDLLLISCGVMYGSYFWLFLMFYLKRYNSEKPPVVKKQQ